MDNIYYDGNLKASLTVGSVGGISKKQLDEALSTKADINHEHEQYLTVHQDISHLATKNELNNLNNDLYDAKTDITEIQDALIYRPDYDYVDRMGTDRYYQDLVTENKYLVSAINELYQMVYELQNPSLANFYTEYTIKTDLDEEILMASFEDTIQDGGYLPELSHNSNHIFLRLKNGTMSANLNTLASDVESIRIYYPEETNKISFADTKVKTIESINVTNVTDCTGMFQNCNQLESIDLSDINTNEVTVDTSMFEGVSEECKITVGKKWDVTEEETGFSGTFINPWKYYIEYTIEKYDINNNIYLDWDNFIPRITLDENCDDIEQYIQDFKLVEVYLTDGRIITESIDEILTNDVERIIAYYPEETVSIIAPPNILTLEYVNTENFKNLHFMFASTHITEIKGIEDWDISNVISMAGMFSVCKSLTSLDLSNWNIDNVTNIAMMFDDCTSLKTLNLSTWNTTNYKSSDSYFDIFRDLPEDIDWCHDENDPNSYANWTLTEEQTGFSGTFPWNQRNEEKIKIHIIDPVNAYNSAYISDSGGLNISFDISVNKTIEIDASLLELDKYPSISVSGENSANGTNIDNITGSEMWYDTIGNILQQYDYSYETSLLKINYIHHLMAVDPINICVINGLSRDYSCNLDYGTTECQLELEVVNSYSIYIEMNGVPYDSFDITAANEIWLLSGDKHIYTERPEIPNYEQVNLRIHLFRENEENYDSYNASIAFGDGNWDSSFEMNNDEYGGYLEYSLYTNINYRITVYANNYSESDNPHVILLEEPISDIWLIWGDDNIYYENPLEDDSAQVLL